MSSPYIYFGRELCNDFDQASRREWYLSNGLGAYASGTICGCLSRRYHGLLLSPLHHPLDRHLLLAKADATISIDNKSFPLFSNLWKGNIIEPHGYQHIEAFYLDGNLPVWIFNIMGLRLQYRIWMEQGKHSSWIAVKLLDSCDYQNISINWDIMVNCRDHHSQMHPSGCVLQTSLKNLDNKTEQLTIDYPNEQKLNLFSQSGSILPQYLWIENFYLSRENERGLPELDNHLKIASITMQLAEENHYYGFNASMHELSSFNIEQNLKQQQDYQQQLVTTAKMQFGENLSPLYKTLIQRADSFLFKRPLANNKQSPPDKAKSGDSIIAGYPWFGDWGRDTMISLPGICLATGKAKTARDILINYAAYVDKGMIPNMFPEQGETAEYNTVDAALWFIVSSYQTYHYKANKSFLKKLFPAMQEIINYYISGTRYGIKMDSDGLISAGENGYQLTWMDARIGDWVVTPRYGKAVEINALWINALKIMQEFSSILQNTTQAQYYKKLSQSSYDSFVKFIDPEQGLYDCIEGDTGIDDSIRPNQLFAISLPFLCVDQKQGLAILSTIQKHLLCSHGLRSLSPNDANYRSHYQGGVLQRDSAYHQGTVWAWLLGHYAIAEYRLKGNKQKSLDRLLPLARQVFDAGLGSISEIFDAEPPHLPRGTPSQAWSVATILEAIWRIENNYHLENHYE